MGELSKMFLLLVLCVIASVSITAQNSVNGKIVNENKEGLDAVVVMFVSLQNNALVETNITNDIGEFSISLTTGNYTLYVRSLGYKDYQHNIYINEDTILPDIQLESENFLLNDVVVTARKSRPLVKSINGKIQINVSESYLTDIGNALDVLKRSPGVSVSNQGTISLASLGGTAVYINGKKIVLQGDELSSYLRSLSSSKIERIETSPNPNARYEADGAGGIINIVLKTTEKPGFFVTSSQGLSYWWNLQNNSDISVSYNTNKWQLGVNYSHGIGHYSMKYGNEKLQDGNKSISETTDTDKRNSYSGGLDLVWSPNAQHKLSVNSSASLLAGPGETMTTSYLYKGLNKLNRILRASNNYLKQQNLRYTNNINYQYSPSSKQSFSLTADWTHFDGLAHNEQPNSYFSAKNTPLNTDIFYSQPKKNIDIYALLADFRYAPNEQNEWLVGIKASIIQSNNSFLFERNAILDLNRSNIFHYNENNIEGYTQYAHNWNKWMLSAGLRIEYMRTIGRLNAYTTNDTTEENEAPNLRLFPNFTLSYSRNEKSKFSILYSRRQDKPRYEDLNPFEYLLDELSYWKGNPFLKPQISNKFTLGYTYSKLLMNLSYNILDDYFTSITDVFGANKTVMTTKNIGQQQQLGMEAMYSSRLSSWWDISANMGLYYFVNKLDYEQYRQIYKQPSYILAVSNNFLLPWALNLELSGRYYSKRQGGSYEIIKPTGSIDVGLSKTRLEGRLRLSLLITDILHSERWDSYGRKDALSISSWGYGESRKVMFRISYNFGKQKFSTTNSTIEELNRL